MLNLNTIIKQENKIKSIIFGLAICFHLMVIFQKINLADFSSTYVDVNNSEPLKIQYIDHEKIQQAIEKNHQILKRQIVQTQESENNKKSETAFLGEKDTFFERQTVARVVDKFNNGGGETNSASKSQSDGNKSTSSKKIKKLTFKDIGMGLNKQTPEILQEENQFQRSQLGSGRGISSTNDYIEDVPLGDFTKLNTQEFKFYGFYHRIRTKLEQFWGRNIQEQAEKVFKQGRRIPASENHVTSLLIKINSKGEIVNVKVNSTSGIKELDDAAIDSFNQAGPFPNPPSEMLVNGLATIEWGFVVNG